MKNIYKISIVTPSFNQGQFLEETIQSILNQNYTNLEYIIIDGGSTDNSLEIIKKYEKYLTYWVSEKDNGQTHAINKGFKIATGQFVNWINSDDLLENGALNKLNQKIIAHPSIDIIYGDYKAIDKDSKLIYKRKASPYFKNCLYWGRQLSSQPSVFFKKELLNKYGNLNEDINFCMDIEFWIRCAKNRAKFLQINSILGVTRVHSDAKTTNLQQLLYDEHKAIISSYNSLNFIENNKLKNITYNYSNKFWRGVSAINRLIYRNDFSFGQASKALRDIE